MYAYACLYTNNYYYLYLYIIILSLSISYNDPSSNLNKISSVSSGEFTVKL